MTDPKLPLGRETGYPNKYDPELLFAIARAESRAAYLSGTLPFLGEDVWNCWDLTWLQPDGLPVAATAELRVPADSPNLIESKSLKLYLNSFAMSRFDSPDSVAERIGEELSSRTGAAVAVRILAPDEHDSSQVSRLPGVCLDTLAIAVSHGQSDATLLECKADDPVEEQLYSHLLRSLCPVTGQPDIGSIAIHYAGPRIVHESLLRYIVSLREHNDFHEACVERIFVDLMERCQAEKLSVYARYQRRGGIDINPFRSNWQPTGGNPRLWRQ